MGQVQLRIGGASRLPLPDPAPQCEVPQLVSLATAAGIGKSLLR